MKKKAIVSIFAMVLTLSMILITSYAYFRPKGGVISTPTSITTKNLDLTVDYTGNVATVFNDIMPMPDNTAITKPGFEFSVTNDGDDWQFYKISIVDLGINQNETKINSLDLKLNISEKNNPRLGWKLEKRISATAHAFCWTSWDWKNNTRPDNSPRAWSGF